VPSLTLDRFAAALFFLAVAFAACFMPAQNDTWWHLRAGKEILATGTIPLRDSFSHTVHGGYWPDHEWLSQVIMYSAFDLGGLPLLTGAAAALVTATWLMVWRLTPGPWAVRLVLAAIGVMPFAPEWSLRPQLFTLLLLAVTIWLLVGRRELLLPILFCAWANLHGGVMLGMIVMTAVAFGTVIAERRLLNRAVAVTGLCALATTITPLGFSLWTEVPAALERSRGYNISEWRRVSIADPMYLPFWLLASLFVALVISRKPWRTADGTVNVRVWGALGLLPVALSASRNVAALMVVLVPAIGGALRGWQLPLRRSSRRRERPLFNAVVIGAASVAAVAVVGWAWASELARLEWHPLRQEAIAAVSACPGKLYNRYDDGGYLIWFVPDRKVFIDSRQDPYPPELVREHIRVETSGEYADMFRRYSIDCALVPSESLLARRLTADRWRPLYRDTAWSVLARGTETSEYASSSSSGRP
jgi:hypothetical protein